MNAMHPLHKENLVIGVQLQERQNYIIVKTCKLLYAITIKLLIVKDASSVYFP